MLRRPTSTSEGYHIDTTSRRGLPACCINLHISPLGFFISIEVGGLLEFMCVMYYTDLNMWAKTKKSKGFTIVELLIVIVIIGILAAITIVAFNGVQGRANDSAIKSDLASIAKQIETIKALSPTSSYPTTTELVSNKLSASKNAYEKSRNNLYYCRTTDNMNYAFGAVSISGKNFFLVNGKVTESTNVWGSTTCDQLTSFGATTGAGSGYDNPTNTWAAWVK